MRRKLLILYCLVMVLSTLAVGTHAYFTKKGSAVNVVTAGNIRIALRGSFGSPETLVMPGTSVDKEAMVENVGEHTAFIRIRVDKDLRLRNPDIVPDISMIAPVYNTEHWIYQDGYYYYGRALDPGELTEPIFSQICFLPQMDNAYQGSTATVKLLVQATQTANNGSDPLSAAGWPGNE